MRIGPYTLSSRLVLAPMAGITDAPFRRLCRRFGAGMATSEMTTADISLWNTRKSSRRLDLDFDDEPRSVQIAGSDPRLLATAARMVVRRGAQIVDINMGCPAKKVCSKLAGSALLQNEALVRQILETVVDAVDVPVTLKIRTGQDPDNRNGVEIARIAESAGIQALAVHGRTRACKFRGNAEYQTISCIKKVVSIPVIANGDIDTSEKSLEVLQLTGADGLMIGRGAQGRPWVFRELDYFLQNGTHIAALEKNKVRDIMLHHLNDLYQFYGERTGVRVARKHLTWYCAELKNSADFRNTVVRAQSASEQLRLTRQFFSRESEGALLAA